MAIKAILKNKSGEILNISGANVLVTGSSGSELALNTELANLRTTINGLVAASDALIFKGILDADNALPTEGYQAGWTYKVGLAGTYAGQACEVGDMLICVADYVAESGGDADWQVVQTNIDGAVTGPESSTADNLAAFNGATGKIIKDSGVSLTDVSDAVSKKHEHSNLETLNALGKDGSGKLTLDGTVVHDGLVECAVINAGEPIPENLRDNGIVFEVQQSE